MGRKSLIRSRQYPYHITARANNREPFEGSLEKLWKNICDTTYTTTWMFGAELHSILLMPNHVHILLSTPELDLGRIMQWWMREVTAHYNSTNQRSGHLFGGRYYWSIIQSRDYFDTATKYLYRNPVRANLCSKAEDYPYSSLRNVLGAAIRPFPIYHSCFSFRNYESAQESEDYLKWLNTPFSSELESNWRRCLSKKIIGGKDGYILKNSRKRLVQAETFLKFDTLPYQK